MRISRRSPWLLLAAGLAVGWLARPVAVWAADRIELDWPSVFKLEANRPIPIETNRAITVKLDDWNIPTVPVKLTDTPSLKLDHPEALASHAPSFGLLRQTPDTTWFVAGKADGHCLILRFDATTGKVSTVGTFDL